MSDRQQLNIMISSAGRRNYLVRWFRQALTKLGNNGQVIVADADPFAASRAEADCGILLPRIDDPSYACVLLERCAEMRVSLLISLNDYELSFWSGMDNEEFLRRGTRIISLDSTTQSAIEDKYKCSILLSKLGLDTPKTNLAANVLGSGAEIFGPAATMYVKHRFGSGSLGLVRTGADQLEANIGHSLVTVKNRIGKNAYGDSGCREAVIVQEAVDGIEYGLDIVNDLDGKFAGVLARRKISMRAGETDQAITTDPRQFEYLAKTISSATRHSGLIDVDVIVDSAQRQWIIDVNPRFGGGYPFSHIAGADVPSCYLTWMLGGAIDDSWLQPRLEVVGSKSQEVSGVQQAVGVR